MDNAAAAYDDIMNEKVGEIAFDMPVRDESGEQEPDEQRLQHHSGAR